MDCHWLKSSPSLKKGITIINQLEETKFEPFLRRIVAKLMLQDTEIFTEDERQKLEKIFKINEEDLMLAIKSIIYLFKRLMKYIFMPVNVKNDLKVLGFSEEKTEFIVKIWSTETRTTLNELNSKTIDDSLNFSWKLNAELSSDFQKKCKVPKAYLCLSGGENQVEVEMTHSELYSMFRQFESIQNELDNFS